MIKVLSHTYPVVLRGSLECPKLSFETTQALEKVHPQRGWEAAFPRRYLRRFFSQDWGYKHRQSSVSYRGDPGVDQDNDLLLEISSVGISLVVRWLTLCFQRRGNTPEQAGELRYIVPLGQKQNTQRCHQILPVSGHQTWGKKKRPKVDNRAQLPKTKAHIPLESIHKVQEAQLISISIHKTSPELISFCTSKVLEGGNGHLRFTYQETVNHGETEISTLVF